MATKRLNIPTKQTGDLLTATEFNATMQGVNDNYDDILALQRASENQNEVVESVRKEQNTQKSSIKSLTQYYADVANSIDQLYKAIQDGADVDVSKLKPITITANDTPADGGIDPFSTGGAFKHLVKKVKVVRGERGALSLQLLNENGDVISDNDFEVKDGVTPIFLGGETGLEVSYDWGRNYNVVLPYSKWEPKLDGLIEAYNNIKKEKEQFEADEAARKTAEASRETAENARNTNEDTRKQNENTRQNLSKKYKDMLDHPNIMLDNGNWGEWNYDKQEYEDTGIVARGGVMFPTFAVLDNSLYVSDGENDNITERVKLQDNSLVLVL